MLSPIIIWGIIPYQLTTERHTMNTYDHEALTSDDYDYMMTEVDEQSEADDFNWMDDTEEDSPLY